MHAASDIAEGRSWQLRSWYHVMMLPMNYWSYGLAFWVSLGMHLHMNTTKSLAVVMHHSYAWTLLPELAKDRILWFLSAL